MLDRQWRDSEFTQCSELGVLVEYFIHNNDGGTKIYPFESVTFKPPSLSFGPSDQGRSHGNFGNKI